VHFTLTDLIADITQNGVESGASLVELELHELRGSDSHNGAIQNQFRFVTHDNGKGMSASELDRAMDPFVTDGIKHPGRKVGLGLPFLVQTAIQSGGGWSISSGKAEAERSFRRGGQTNKAADSGNTDEKNRLSGTSVEAWFDLSNVDTPPLGDIPGLFRTVLLFSRSGGGPEEMILKRSRSGSSNDGLDYEVTKTGIIEALGDLEDASSLILLKEYLQSLENG